MPLRALCPVSSAGLVSKLKSVWLWPWAAAAFMDDITLGPGRRSSCLREGLEVTAAAPGPLLTPAGAALPTEGVRFVDIPGLKAKYLRVMLRRRCQAWNPW